MFIHDAILKRIVNWLNIGIPKEAELIFLCSRMQIDPVANKRIRELLNDDVNWRLLRTIAKRNKILPLIYNTLFNNFKDEVPRNEFSLIGDDYNQNIKKNNYNLKVLIEIINLFKQEEIPVIPFKGIVFSKLAYGSISFRDMFDIDLLVKPLDFLRAKDLLIRSGFNSRYFGHAEVCTVQAQLVRHENDNQASADLHYRLTPQYQQPNMDEATLGSDFNNNRRINPTLNRNYWFFSLPCEPLWDRAQTIDVNGNIFPVFSPEDSLLLAVIHGLKENWRTLSRICDIAALIEAYPKLN